MAKLLTLLDGSAVKVNGKEVYEAIVSGAVKQVNVEGRRMTMVGTDETVDRDGDIIELKGWQLENYRKNPVFLWSHNYGSVPLARAEKVIRRREPACMEFHLLYPTRGIHPFADMILELYGENIINASSVGFIPWEWDDIKEDEKLSPIIDPKVVKGTRRTWGRRYTKQELLELSGCAVPANPNALQNALKSKNFMDKPFEEVQRWLQGQALPPRPKQEDDVFGELVDKEMEIVDETDPKVFQVPQNYEADTKKEEEEGFT